MPLRLYSSIGLTPTERNILLHEVIHKIKQVTDDSKSRLKIGKLKMYFLKQPIYLASVRIWYRAAVRDQSSLTM